MFLSQIEQADDRFADLREDFLLNYGHNTARAYWNDLEDIKDWAQGRGLDMLELTQKQFRQYLARMRRGGYSPSTVRRRQGTWRLFAKAHGLEISGARRIHDEAIRRTPKPSFRSSRLAFRSTPKVHLWFVLRWGHSPLRVAAAGEYFAGRHVGGCRGETL